MEIGSGILPEEQNRGFATEPATGLITWAFSTDRVEEAVAECMKDNAVSVKVLQKLGMQ